MDAGTWRGVFTALMLLLFIAVCIWAFSGRRKADFEEASRLPLEEDEQEDRTRSRSGVSTVTERNK